MNLYAHACNKDVLSAYLAASTKSVAIYSSDDWLAGLADDAPVRQPVPEKVVLRKT